MCGWQNMASNDLDWIIISPKSGFTYGEHMPFDHTLQAIYGNYLLLPVQSERSFTSTLQSEIYHKKSEHICFRMYYFARGNHSSQPVVAMKLYFIDLTHADASIGHPVLINASVTTPNSNLFWLKVEHEFRHVGRVFQFQISVTSNSNVLSDIGLDDIKIVDSACSNGDVTPTPPVPVSEKVLDADFDENTKNWSYDKNIWNVTSFSIGKFLNKKFKCFFK